MDEAKQAIEPLFLSRALAQSASLRIVQMNRSEHAGVLREIGRYEINLEEKNAVVTLLKKDISYVSAAAPLISSLPATSPEEASSVGTVAATGPAKPNIQQEFLDKAIREKQPVTIYLITGQRMRAMIEAYDNFTVLVRDGGQQHLCYKHSITTINR